LHLCLSLLLFLLFLFLEGFKVNFLLFFFLAVKRLIVWIRTINPFSKLIEVALFLFSNFFLFFLLLALFGLGFRLGVFFFLFRHLFLIIH